MSLPGYKKSRTDFEYLEILEELDDHVNVMDEVQNFMRSPTKAFATTLYHMSINKWLLEQQLKDSDLLQIPRVKRIKERYL